MKFLPLLAALLLSTGCLTATRNQHVDDGKFLATALYNHFEVSNGMLPEDISELRTFTGDDFRLGQFELLLNGHRSDFAQPARTAIFRHRVASGGGRATVFLDGHVEWIPDSNVNLLDRDDF